MNPLPQLRPDPVTSTARFYEVHAKEYFDRTISADLSNLYDRFLARVRPGGRVLDAGCGSGRDLLNFRERGFNVLGIDASDALVKMAREYSGVPCHVIRLEDIDYKACFDGVWACASLLHFRKSEVVPVLRRLREALKPGGTMFASVQIGDGEAFVADGRFYAYYEHQEFLRLVEEGGFVINESWITEDARRPSISWINVLAATQ